MLVLTRKPEEKVVISIGEEDQIVGLQDQIVVTILKIQGGKVSLGIEADKKWEILRQELIEPKMAKKEKEKEEEARELEESCVDG